MRLNLEAMFGVPCDRVPLMLYAPDETVSDGVLTWKCAAYGIK
jgi:hypothetical protein